MLCFRIIILGSQCGRCVAGTLREGFHSLVLMCFPLFLLLLGACVGKPVVLAPGKFQQRLVRCIPTEKCHPLSGGLPG